MNNASVMNNNLKNKIQKEIVDLSKQLGIAEMYINNPSLFSNNMHYTEVDIAVIKTKIEEKENFISMIDDELLRQAEIPDTDRYLIT